MKLWSSASEVAVSVSSFKLKERKKIGECEKPK